MVIALAQAEAVTAETASYDDPTVEGRGNEPVGPRPPDESQGRGGWRRRVMAWMMAHAAGGHESLVSDRKRRLLGALHGSVLEIGPGTGTNLSYYPEDVRWLGIEPNRHMVPYLQREATRLGRAAEVRIGAAESLDVPDESMDFVVSTLVLCSVDDLSAVLREALRVLRPGGRFCFLEHVAAADGSRLHLLQRAIGPVWRALGDGCRPDRDPLRVLRASGFAEVVAEPFQLPIPVIGPHLAGYARKGPR